MKDFFERLHYMATVSTVATVSLLVAVVIEQGWGQAAIKMSLIVIVLFLMNAVLTHATARAARVRNLGHWQPAEGEKMEGLDQIARGRRPKK
jgi:monovalent cation/proton antiporter MnhG/PhaG subunit